MTLLFVFAAVFVISLVVYFRWKERRSYYNIGRDSGPIESMPPTVPEIYIPPPRPAAGVPASAAARVAPRPAPLAEARRRQVEVDHSPIYTPNFDFAPASEPAPSHSYHGGGGHSGGGGAGGSYDSSSHSSDSSCSSSSDSSSDCGGGD